MALSPSKQSNTGLNTSIRRLRYGLNVVISAVVATGILVFAILIAREYRGQLDWTSSGFNSLSPRTEKLLTDVLDEPLRITALYSVPLAEDVEPVFQRRRDTMSDLLDLYAAAGNVDVEVIDPLRDQLAVTNLLSELSAMPAYADEATPHREFIERFETFNPTMKNAIDAIDAKCIEIVKTYPAMNRNSEFGLVVIGLRNVSQASETVKNVLEDIKSTDQPRYGAAAGTVTTAVNQMRGLVETARDWFGSQTSNVGLPPDAQAVFKEAHTDIIPIADELSALSNVGTELGDVKLDELLAEFSDLVARPAVLIRNDKKAEVVGFDDVWPFPIDPQAPRGDGPDPDRDFAGEQALSSAILRLTQTERIGLVFVRFGGQPLLQPDFSNFNPMMGQLPQAPYQRMREELERENFVVEEWDVKASPTPPSMPEVSDSVYIVFKPTEPQQTNPMQPPSEPGINPEQKQAIYDAVEASGMGIFMAGWAPPQNDFGLSAGYAYDEYLETQWGISVASGNVMLRFLASAQDDNLWVPDQSEAIMMNTRNNMRFMDHPISTPLRSLAAGLPAALPLALVTGEGAPENVEYSPLIEVTETERIWAVADLNRLRADLQNNFGTAPKPEDIQTPAVLAYAAKKTIEGQSKPKRVVVFGSDQFATDNIALAMSIGRQGNALVQYQVYPGNRDLLINTVHWLSGDAARIAVGPQRGGVPTLDKLTDGPAVGFLKAFTVGIWPALALGAGGIVWLFRRS